MSKEEIIRQQPISKNPRLFTSNSGIEQTNLQLRDVPWHTGLDQQLLGKGANIALGVAAGWLKNKTSDWTDVTHGTATKVGLASNVASNAYGLVNTGKTVGTAIKTANTAKTMQDGLNAARITSKANIGQSLKGIAPMLGEAAGNWVGGKNRAFGYGTMISDLGADIISYFGPWGWAIATATKFINHAGIGQKRAINVKDFSNEFASPYTGTAMNVGRDIAMYSGKKAGTFDFGFRRRANKRLIETLGRQNRALANVNEGINMKSAINADISTMDSQLSYAGSRPQLTLAGKSGLKIPELEEIRNLMKNWNSIEKFQQGGVLEKNVIPTGALHKNKHHLEKIRPELDGQITEKGIPVVSSDIAENVTQFAEIESAEIILSKPVTEQVEELYNKYKNSESDDIAIELGKFLVDQILHNTIDKDKIIKKTV